MTVTISTFPVEINFNELSGFPFLKSSCAYTTKFLVELENHNHRHLLQNPYIPQHRVSLFIENENQNIFIVEAKPSSEQLNRYYITVGVSSPEYKKKLPIKSSEHEQLDWIFQGNNKSLTAFTNKRNNKTLNHSIFQDTQSTIKSERDEFLINETNNSIETTLDFDNINEVFKSTAQISNENAHTIEGVITLLVNDNEETKISLRVVATFVDGITYEKYYTRKEAISRGYSLSGGPVKLWRASDCLDLGCSLIWRNEEPYILRNTDSELDDWGFHILFPYTAEFKDEDIQNQNFSQDESQIQNESNESNEANKDINYENSERDALDITEIDDSFDSFDDSTLQYLRASCRAHNSWINRVQNIHSNSLDLKTFVSQFVNV